MSLHNRESDIITKRIDMDDLVEDLKKYYETNRIDDLQERLKCDILSGNILEVLDAVNTNLHDFLVMAMNVFHKFSSPSIVNKLKLAKMNCKWNNILKISGI